MLDVAPPNNDPWKTEIQWADIVRVCFEATDLYSSDTIYIFVRGRENSYPVPVDGAGGAELWDEIINRGLFDPQKAIDLMFAEGKTECWPPS